MRRAARVDGNHAEIRDAFRACGLLVESLAQLGDGVPDLLVSDGARCWLVEAKMPKGNLTKAQVAWQAKGWPVYLARRVEDVPAIVRAMGA